MDTTTLGGAAPLTAPARPTPTDTTPALVDSAATSAAAAAGCPYHAGRLTQPPGREWDKLRSPSVELRPGGVAAVRGFAAARAVLRAGYVARQDGFGVREISRSPVPLKPPVLFQDGEEHRAQRTAIARFFTPKAAKEHYRPVMERLTDELLDELTARGRADLSQLAMRLAVSVASQVVGLTNSKRPGMHARLDAFLSRAGGRLSWRPRELLDFALLQLGIVRFFNLDVRPAIAARRESPKDDVISHLISQGAKDRDILIEAITYGAAGMVTTREFICAAALHLLQDAELRSRYQAADELERQRLLSEIVRLEPVVGKLFRRLDGDLRLETEVGEMVLPAGTAIEIDVRSANADPEAVGTHPLCLRADRIPAKGVQPFGLSFGDGAHRCPGGYLALEEADVFLHRLLALPGLRIERAPRQSYHELVQGYELRDFIVAVSA